ncbi:MoaD/ThiS family protein [Pseudarthrobacter sp. J1738]|uniref:MoaD/ThiS family protein n=1 Tax=unclassified Pseudarthrobacter TaxID=2647000 RepID=UPI003D28E995
MLIRYFAAASAAAGTDEERLELPSGTSLEGLLKAILGVERSVQDPNAPALSTVLARSSFLLNGVATRHHQIMLDADDTVDVLPPFAGG